MKALFLIPSAERGVLPWGRRSCLKTPRDGTEGLQASQGLACVSDVPSVGLSPLCPQELPCPSEGLGLWWQCPEPCSSLLRTLPWGQPSMRRWAGQRAGRWAEGRKVGVPPQQKGIPQPLSDTPSASPLIQTLHPCGATCTHPFNL